VRCRDKDTNEREIRAKYVVDASGHGSVLASTVGARQHSEFFRNMAIYTYFENGKRNPPPLSGNINLCSIRQGVVLVHTAFRHANECRSGHWKRIR
jgi:halogenation protein CepH